MKRAFDTIAMQSIKINELEKQLTDIKIQKSELDWHEIYKLNYLIEKIVECEDKGKDTSKHIAINFAKDLFIFCRYIKNQKNISETWIHNHIAKKGVYIEINSEDNCVKPHFGIKGKGREITFNY